MVDPTASRLVPERPRLTVAFLVLALAVTAGFAPTFDAYVAVDGVQNAEPRVTSATPGPDGDVLEVSLRFDNPTRSKVTIISGQLTAWDGDMMVTRLAGARMERTTVGGGETDTVPTTLDIDPETRYQALSAAEDGRLRFKGFLWVNVGNERVKVQIRPHMVVDDDE